MSKRTFLSVSMALMLAGMLPVQAQNGANRQPLPTFENI